MSRRLSSAASLDASLVASLVASLALVALPAACSSDRAGDGPATQPRELGLGDVSFLLPPGFDRAGAPIATLEGFASAEPATPLVPRALYDSLYAAPGDIAPKTGSVSFEQFHVVAVRFDLCDRANQAPCGELADGVFRVVLQPTYFATTGGGQELRAHDVALHAFYQVPNGELADVVAELRAIANLEPAPTPPQATPLAPFSSSASSPRLLRLRALLARYLRQERLLRLTVFGQDASSVAFAWILRGVERPSLNDAFAPITIAQLGSAQQSVRLGGGDIIYISEPAADLPAGFALALNGPTFNAAPVEDRRTALRALVAIQNPALHDTGDLQCIACHVATVLVRARQAGADVDAAALPEHFEAPYPLSPGGLATTDARVLRGFGYAGSAPVISQRVLNETAQVLREIARRYPPPP